MASVFSSETTEARRRWHTIFKELKGKNCQPRILYPEKITFRNEGKLKMFSDEGKLREYTVSRSSLQETLMAVLQTEGNSKNQE